MPLRTLVVTQLALGLALQFMGCTKDGQASDKDAAALAPDGGSDAGADAAGTPPAHGPGIGDDTGEVFCLMVQESDEAAFFFGIRTQCFIWNKRVGKFSADERKNYETACTDNYMGSVVGSCPATGRVAYCAGARSTADGYVDETHVIYKTAINPSTAIVARSELGVCQSLEGFALDDSPLDAKCTGTFTAKVDGKPVDFSAALVCLFKTDGTRFSMTVRGIEKPDWRDARDGKELTVQVIEQNGKAELESELGNLPYSYLEGASSAGAFRTAVTGSMPTLAVTKFAMDGSALKATFELGDVGKTASSKGADKRTITEGVLEITYQ